MLVEAFQLSLAEQISVIHQHREPIGMESSCDVFTAASVKLQQLLKPKLKLNIPIEGRKSQIYGFFFYKMAASQVKVWFGKS